MRENPDTSLKLLRLLADEEHYPSRLTGNHIASQLEITGQETVLYVACCVHNGLMEAGVHKQVRPDGRAILVGPIWGLTARGQDFVRNAEAAEGTWWRKSKERCARVGVEASTSALAETMASLARAALAGGS